MVLEITITSTLRNNKEQNLSHYLIRTVLVYEYIRISTLECSSLLIKI